MFCVWRRTIGLIERISSEYTRSGVSICGVFIYSMHAVIFARVSTKQCTMQSSAHTLRRTIPQSLHHVYMQFLKLPLLNMWNLFATIAGFSLSAAYHDWPLERGIEKERKIEQKKKICQYKQSMQKLRYREYIRERQNAFHIVRNEPIEWFTMKNPRIYRLFYAWTRTMVAYCPIKIPHKPVENTVVKMIIILIFCFFFIIQRGHESIAQGNASILYCFWTLYLGFCFSLHQINLPAEENCGNY